MNETLLDKLKVITPEEQMILDGNMNIQKSLYSNSDEFIIDSNHMLATGKLIDIRPHTRFVHFPTHTHNYIEIIYMCSGSTTHIVNGDTKIPLKTGQLLFLNQHASQEILPAGENDIAINFIILPQFFDRCFALFSDENVLRDFLLDALKNNNGVGTYLHFEVQDILPIQNLIENLIWSLMNSQPNKRNINQTTMGLLFLQLMNHTDKINQNDPTHYEQNLFFAILKYVEEHYVDASLEELSAILKQPTYFLSKLIKKHSSSTFKNLLQTKRLNQSVYLLSTTTIPVEEIITLVGYDNTSYFHKIFKERFGMTPKRYRENCC
ncbi:MAG: AraC family transcriptional regulator [Eubacteriales bacterium]